MNIIEATKSGKKMRRKGWEAYWNTNDLSYTREDLLADDWEVEQVPVSITQEQFFHAFAEALKETGAFRDYGSYTEVVNVMAQKLGIIQELGR
jgi:hypothetical protein